MASARAPVIIGSDFVMGRPFHSLVWASLLPTGTAANRAPFGLAAGPVSAGGRTGTAGPRDTTVTGATMDALELLTADHNRVRGLFSRFQAAEGKDEAEAQRLAATIFEELEVHTKIEEQVFYPAVSDCNEELHDLVAEGIEEHHVVESLMAEAKGLLPSDDAWAAKLKVLIENVEHHAEEEEEELFPLVRKALDDAARSNLAERTFGNISSSSSSAWCSTFSMRTLILAAHSSSMGVRPLASSMRVSTTWCSCSPSVTSSWISSLSLVIVG